MRLKLGGKYYRTTPRFNKIVLCVAVTTSLATDYFAHPNKAMADSTPLISNQINQPTLNWKEDTPFKLHVFQSFDVENSKPAYFDLPFKPLFFQQPQVLPIPIEVPTKPPKIESFKLLSNNNEVETLNLNKPSHLTVQQADAILKGTQLEGLGEAFIRAEIEYNVNALYLISHAALESEWGKSKIARYKNNLFGFSAYDENPGRYATQFETKNDCIQYVTKYISEHYLTEGGDWYKGPTLKGMNINYATDRKWADKIAATMLSVQDRIVDANLMF